MKRKILFAVFVALPVLLICQGTVIAQEETLGTVRIGEHDIQYDETFVDDFDGDGIAELTLYYLEGVLVASAEDTNADGKPDFWLRYTPDWYADMEVRDRDFDGEPDEFISMDENEQILDVEKTGGENADGGMEGVMIAIFAVTGLIVISVAAFGIYVRNRRAEET